MPKKIAFCFLLYNTVKHSKIWEDFFSQDEGNTHSIYTHLKSSDEKTQKWLKKHRVPSIKTEYCKLSLVYAWIQLLQHALKDPSNKYFIILSGECVPVFTYNKVYQKITRSKKSRINIDAHGCVTHETGYYWADQWCILNRKHAELLVKLKTTEEGRKFAKKVTKEIIYDFCPDEIVPVNWFAKKYGKISGKKFQKEFRRIPTTFTHWDNYGSWSPKKLNKTMLKKLHKKICESGAVFARKFYGTSAKQVAMSC